MLAFRVTYHIIPYAQRMPLRMPTGDKAAKFHAITIDYAQHGCMLGCIPTAIFVLEPCWRNRLGLLRCLPDGAGSSGLGTGRST